MKELNYIKCPYCKYSHEGAICPNCGKDNGGGYLGNKYGYISPFVTKPNYKDAGVSKICKNCEFVFDSGYICPNCGCDSTFIGEADHEDLGDSLICEHCGLEFYQTAHETICPYCKADFSKDNKMEYVDCSNCGYSHNERTCPNCCFPISKTKTETKTEVKALRYNEGKRDWTLLDYNCLHPLVDVMTYGSKKYTRDNWKNTLDDSNQHIQCAMRHLIAIINGEELDPESGLRHSGHIMANMMMYNYHTKDV